MRRNPPRFLDTPSELPPNLAFVLNLSPAAMTLGLGNIRALVEKLGHPEKNFRSVVVAGTNGKGSVTAFLSSILQANGKHVGWYSSPHVFSVTERICVDGEPVSLDVMEEAAARIVPLHDSIGYSYFEALTAIAFLVFAERGVDIAVLETGLGGRFDATNVVEPDVCVLTGVSLDHRRILGDTEEEILREKLGIVRPGVPLITGPLSPELWRMVRERARNDGVPLFALEDLGRIVRMATDFSGMSAALRTRRRDYGRVRLPFPGVHQLGNALLAIGAAEKLLGHIDHIDRAAESTYMPGRFETFDVGGKRVVFDVAHNDASLVSTCQTLASLSDVRDNAIVMGVLRRKELTDFPRMLPGWARRLYLVEPLCDEFLGAPEALQRLGISALRDSGLDIIGERFFETAGDWDRFIGQILSPSNRFATLLFTGSHKTVEAFGRHFHRMGLI